MTYLTILEKLQILFNTILDFKVILAFTILILVVTLLHILKVINQKKYFIMMLISFILLFGISIISNYKILSNTFDNFMTIFFRGIYFPSIYIYIAILIINLIIFIISISNKLLKRSYKIINTTNFILNNILLVIILNIIAKNKVDIFSVNSLYTNTSLVAILEISTGLFLIWFGALLITYITNTICNALTRTKKEVVTSELVNIPEVSFINEELAPIATPTEAISVIPETVMANEIVDTVIDNKEEVSVIEQPQEVLTIDKVEQPQEVSVIDKVEEPITINNEVIEPAPKELTINDILSSITPVECENNAYSEVYTISDPQELYEEKYHKSVEEKESFQDIANEVIEEIPSLNDDLSSITISYNDEIIDKHKENNFSLEDYKKIAKMLKEIKNYTSNNVLSVEDAINLTLISNYSIDDCLKFKDILESSLN